MRNPGQTWADQHNHSRSDLPSQYLGRGRGLPLTGIVYAVEPEDKVRGLHADILLECESKRVK